MCDDDGASTSLLRVASRGLILMRHFICHVTRQHLPTSACMDYPSSEYLARKLATVRAAPASAAAQSAPAPVLSDYMERKLAFIASGRQGCSSAHSQASQQWSVRQLAKLPLARTAGPPEGDGTMSLAEREWLQQRLVLLLRIVKGQTELREAESRRAEEDSAAMLFANILSASRARPRIRHPPLAETTSQAERHADAVLHESTMLLEQAAAMLGGTTSTVYGTRGDALEDHVRALRAGTAWMDERADMARVGDSLAEPPARLARDSIAIAQAEASLEESRAALACAERLGLT